MQNNGFGTMLGYSYIGLAAKLIYRQSKMNPFGMASIINLFSNFQNLELKIIEQEMNYETINNSIFEYHRKTYAKTVQLPSKTTGHVRYVHMQNDDFV